jgi:putative transposase
MARGNRREPIFLDKEDGKHFVKALGERALLSSRYHLMIETPEANLVAGMKWLQNTLTPLHGGGVTGGV